MPSRSQKSSSEKARNFKLTLEYDGSAFFGFQRQKNAPTIQGELEKALSRLFGKPTKISAAAGRTDSGVHASSQIVNFKTDSVLPLFKIQQALNAFLPPAIAVRKIEEIETGFHARFHARSKIYEYVVLNSRVRSPLLEGRVFRFPHPIRLSLMKQAAGKLVGKKDFGSFRSAGSNTGSSVRHIRRLSVQKKGELLKFTVEGDGFLYKMVRNMVGALLEVGRGTLSPDEFSRNFKQGKAFGLSAPPQGLTLVAVKY